MNRLRGISLRTNTTKDSVKQMMSTIFPKWAYANNENSIAFSDISEAKSKIESADSIKEKYSDIFENGGFFDFHTAYITQTEYDDFLFTDNYEEFLSQKPSSFIFEKKVTSNYDLSNIIASEGLYDPERQQIILKSFDSSKTVYTYMLPNNKIIRESKIDETRNVIYNIIPPTDSIEFPIYIFSDQNITFEESQDYIPMYLTGKNYSKKYDLDKDGYISEKDLIIYSALHNINYDDIVFFKDSVDKTGWYILYTNRVEVLYRKNEYIGIFNQNFKIQNNENIKKASQLPDETIVILDGDGKLTIGDFIVNSLLSYDDKIINYDISNNIFYLLVETSKIKNIFLFDYYNLEMNKIIEISEGKSIVILPDDHIVIFDNNEYTFYKPEYNLGYKTENDYYYLSDLNRNELFIPNSENTENGVLIIDPPEKITKYDLQSIKLQTYLDMIFQPYGIQRWYGEELYDFYRRFNRIISRDFSDYREVISEHFGMDPKYKPESIYTSYIRRILPEIHTNVKVRIDDITYILERRDNDYVYNDIVIMTYKESVVTVYDTIKFIPKYINASNYMVSIESDDGLQISLLVYFGKNHNNFLTDLTIENVDEENIKNSSEIYDRHYNQIYGTHYTYGNIINGISQLDTFSADRFSIEGKLTPKYSDDHVYTLPKNTFGLYDGHSFGDQKISISNTILPNDIHTILSTSQQDSNSLVELSNTGSNQIIKFTCNSGYVVDDGEIKLYGTFLKTPLNDSYYRKISVKPKVVDGNALDTPDYNFDSSQYSYINYNDIVFNKDVESLDVYDDTGRLSLYIQKQMLATGPVYINLKKTKMYPGHLKINEKDIVTYTTKQSLPFPKKIELRYNAYKYEINKLSSNDTMFSDSNFNIYNITIASNLYDLDKPGFIYWKLPQNQPKTLYIDDRTKSEILIDIKTANISNEQIISTQLQLTDMYIDELQLDKQSVNDGTTDISSYIDQHAFLMIFDIQQESITTRPPDKDESYDKIKGQIPEKYVVIEIFQVLTPYYDEKVPGFEFHYKEKFSKCYYLNEERREYLFLNNLFDVRSDAYSKFAEIGAFKRDQKYKIIALVIPKNIVEIYE